MLVLSVGKNSRLVRLEEGPTKNPVRSGCLRRLGEETSEAGVLRKRPSPATGGKLWRADAPVDTIEPQRSV